MSTDERDPFVEDVLRQLDAPAADAPDEAFERDVLRGVRRASLRRWMLRLALAGVLAVVSPPVQDLALAVAQGLAVTLIEIEAGLARDLLAPINTVGSLLSTVLLTLRILHRRVLVLG